MSRYSPRLFALFAGLATAACAGPASHNDSGPDNAALDATTDAPLDAATDTVPELSLPDSTLDEAPAPDASKPVDASDEAPPPDVVVTPDAGSTLAPTVPCTDALTGVYVTPSSLPVYTPEARGDVVRCAPDGAMDTAGVQHVLDTKGVVGVTATSGVTQLRIAYRTTRSAGNSEGVSTARVYLPTSPRSGPLPVVVIAHGSVGLADSCAPSRDANSLTDLALPWVAVGYAVIAPDYAGLGNEGMQGYLDNRDTGYSTLDAARALRKLLPSGTFEPRVLFSGHSQGGGAILSAQSLAGTYGCDGTPAAFVVFAAEWQTRLNSFNVQRALNDPDSLTVAYGITTPAVATQEAFAFFENTYGPGHGGDAFPTASRTTVSNAINGQCLILASGIQQGAQLHVRDWFTPELRGGLLACIAAAAGGGDAGVGADAGGTGDAGASCSGSAQAYYNFLQSNVLTADPHGGPVLYLQGLRDIVMPPAQEAACNVAKLHTEGVDVTACTDDSADHNSVMSRNIAFGIRWTEAVLAGGLRPTCAASALPACTP